MIPITPKPEPVDFDLKVRQPGMAFLQANPTPSSKDFKDYWKNCLPDLYYAYNRVCAYSAHWIPCDVGVATVDHFIPKSVKKGQAYEWSNYRLASTRMNSRKGSHQDVLDPFKIDAGTFIISFKTFRIDPGSHLTPSLRRKASATIKRLKLNDGICINSRISWLEPYCDRDTTLRHLRKRAPFLAYEIERQNISVRELKKLFRVPSMP